MRKILLIIVVLVLLCPTQSMAKKNRINKEELERKAKATQLVKNLNKKRIKNAIVMGKMINYFHKKTGYYPVRPDKLGTINTVIITNENNNIPEGTVPYAVLQKEFFDILGKRAVLAMDPEDEKGQRGRVYKYRTDGQSYWFAVYLSREGKYTKLDGPNLYKVEVTSRPSGEKFQYGVKSIEKFEKFGRDSKRMQGSLFDALESDNYEWAIDLITQGANLSPVCGLNQNCQPLAWAAREGDLTKIKFLLRYGADINGFNAFYDIALMKALEMDELEAAKLLIKSGSNVNSPNTRGLTPFITAILMKKNELVELMLKHGAKVNDHFLLLTTKAKKGEVGMRPLEAAIQSQNEKLVKLLLENGADASMKTAKNTSFLEYAQSLKNKKIVKLISDAVK